MKSSLPRSSTTDSIEQRQPAWNMDYDLEKTQQNNLSSGNKHIHPPVAVDSACTCTTPFPPSLIIASCQRRQPIQRPRDWYKTRRAKRQPCVSLAHNGCSGVSTMRFGFLETFSPLRVRYLRGGALLLFVFRRGLACNGLSPMWASVTLGQPPRKHGLANPWMKAFPLPHRTFQQHARTSTLAG
jgi:hypothetical protein